MFINIATKQRVTESEIRQAFPYTSFAVPFQPPEGYAVVFNAPTPTFDFKTQAYREIEPELIGGKWFQQFEVYNLDADAVAALRKAQESNVRASRNSLLGQSDWTQLADSPADKVAWAAYRQALRDISAQPGFPWDVQWPEQP